MLDDDRLYDVAVTFVPGIGDINAKKLISYFGSAKELFSSTGMPRKARTMRCTHIPI